MPRGESLAQSKCILLNSTVAAARLRLATALRTPSAAASRYETTGIKRRAIGLDNTHALRQVPRLRRALALYSSSHNAWLAIVYGGREGHSRRRKIRRAAVGAPFVRRRAVYTHEQSLKKRSLELKLETKLDAKLETKPGTKLEAKLETKLGTKLEAKLGTEA